MRPFTILSAVLVLAAFPASAQDELLPGVAGTVVVVNKQGNNASFIDLKSGKS